MVLERPTNKLSQWKSVLICLFQTLYSVSYKSLHNHSANNRTVIWSLQYNKIPNALYKPMKKILFGYRSCYLTNQWSLQYNIWLLIQWQINACICIRHRFKHLKCVYQNSLKLFYCSAIYFYLGTPKSYNIIAYIET
jgi:hypothetical protein